MQCNITYILGVIFIIAFHGNIAKVGRQVRKEVHVRTNGSRNKALSPIMLLSRSMGQSKSLLSIKLLKEGGTFLMFLLSRLILAFLTYSTMYTKDISAGQMYCIP